MLAQSPHPKYAPHPGELSGETWPMSMADMTEELLRTRNHSSRHHSLIHSSAYDNRAEAAAGAAALVGSTRVGASPYAAAAAPAPAPMVQSLERGPPAPAMASPPLGVVNHMQASRQFPPGPAHLPAPPPPIRLPASPFLADDYVLPRVVLTPPPDDADAPVTLYPRTSPSPDDYPHRGMSMPVHVMNTSAPSPPRSASLPTIPNDAAPQIAQQQRVSVGPTAQAQAGGVPVVGFQKPTPPFGRKHRSSVAAVVMPKKPEQVINDLERKSGAHFDAEWNELVEGLPSPATGQANGRGNVPAVDKPKMGSSLPFPTRPAPPPPSQAFPQDPRIQPSQQQQRSAPGARGVPEPMRPETPQALKSLKFQKGKMAKEPVTPTEPTFKPKAQRRRSLSLSAMFSKKKKPNFDDLPPMPQTPKTPKTPKTPTRPEIPQLPETPKSTTSEKRKTLLKRASIKELFSSSKSAELKALRKSQSKPELHAGNRLVTQDAPPVPALPSMSSSTALQEHKQVVPDALAALTANSNAQPSEPAVEMVPDVFAAFNSSQTSLQQRGVSAQLKGISAPANPPRAESPFANFEHSTEFAASQQRMQQTNGSQASLTRRAPEAQRVPSSLAQALPKPVEKEEGTKTPKRTRTLSQRLSISALFSKKNKDTEPVPDMPSVPSSYQRAAPQTPTRQQVPPQPNGVTKSASTQELPAVPAFSPMMKGLNETPRPVSAKPPPRPPTTARVPVPRMTNGAEAPDTEQPVPAPPAAPEKPSSTVKKYPDSSISKQAPKQAPLPQAIATAGAKLRGESAPVTVAPPFLDGAKTEDDVKRQSRREQSVVPASSTEYLRQQHVAIASHQQAQQALVQQFRSASEPIAAGPPRSASEQSFQRASNPFAEQAPSAEVIQQAAALVRKPAPMQVVQKAEAEYLNQRKDKEHADKIEKLDEKPLPASWTTFDSEPKPHTTLPLKITKKSSLSAGSKDKGRDKETAPLRINKEPSVPVPVVAALAGAAAAGTAVAVATESSKTGSPGKPSSPEYKENTSFSFPPKPKDAPPALFQPAQKIRRVSVPPLHPDSLNSPHSAIPVPVPEAGSPFSVATRAPHRLTPDLAAANTKLLTDLGTAPVINIITATPARSHEGGESFDVAAEPEADVVSPVLSETSPAVVTTAVRTSIAQTTLPVLTSTANMTQVNEVDEPAQPGSPSDSEFTLPTLESHSSLASEQATPTGESFGDSATPTKSSGMPAMLVAGASALAAAATAAATSISSRPKPKQAESAETEELLEPKEPKLPGSDIDAASIEPGLAYLDGSSVDTHESVQTPSIQPNAGFLSLRPVTDEDDPAANATHKEPLDTPVAETEGDEATRIATTKETPFVEKIEGHKALVEEPVDVDEDEGVDKDEDVQPTHLVVEDRPRPRSESVPPTSSQETLPVGHSMLSLPTRLGVSPVAEGIQPRPAQRSLIYSMAASAASAVSSAVSSAFAEASETLDEIDEKIEKTVKSASPNLGGVAGLPVTSATPACNANATVVQTGLESGQGSVFSGRRRGSSSDDGASIYTTPLGDMGSEYFDSPSASTTSFETASSNATVSPDDHASLPSYSNSAQPPSVALFQVPQPAFTHPVTQRRGSMPVALAASAARKRNVSSPAFGSTELPSTAMPSALGITCQAQRSATMPVSSTEFTELTPPPLPPSADGHSEESSTFHLDTETITDSPTEDFAALPDSPTRQRSQHSRMRDASSMYVVPFSPEMEEQEGRSETRTQTSSNYVPAAGVREHVRRTSGGIRNMFAAAGFGRSERDEAPQRTVLSGQAQPVVPETRSSVAVDYSSPAGSNPTSAAPVGLGMWTAVEIEELGPFRRIAEADTSFEESWSSGSDDHESPRTPRTPELEALVTPRALPGPGTPSPADNGPKRTGAPFRPLHVDMAAEA
ncbi:hypothetical protein CcaverHIS641_0507900 [Cutaneotrichosporon cavernicola]|nr:hypothetical protein CcaverHIS641_0507900 [Cutaneotrichosporon cavernicola]